MSRRAAAARSEVPSRAAGRHPEARCRAGFTLVEVVVAAGLLTLGALALIMAQAQALHAQRRVRVVREIVGAAESELERRIAAGVTGTADCRLSDGAAPLVESCDSTVERCATSDRPCGGGSADRAQRVTVRISGRGGQRFELQAITARFPPP